MLIHSFEVQRYVKASAGRANLSVVFEAKNQPRTDGDTIFLPEITTKTTPEELTHMMASCDHEVAHHEYSDFKVIKEKGIDATTSPLGLIWNFLEDSRVNCLTADQYEGFRQNWDISNSDVINKILDRCKTDANSSLADLVLPLISWESQLNGQRFPLISLSGSSIEHKGTAKLVPFSNRLMDCWLIEAKHVGSTATYELARDIYKAFGGDPDKEEERVKKEKAAGKGEKSPDKGKESKEEGSDGENSSEGEAEEGDGEQVCDEEFKLIEVDYSKCKPPLITTHTVREHPHNVGTLNTDTGTRYGVWKLHDFASFEVTDYVKGTTTLPTGPMPMLDYFSGNYNKYKTTTTEGFANQVRRLIQIRARSRYEFGVKKGKLDQARLARICVKDAPGYNERVFKNKITSNVLDAAVTVLVDMSGSMSGEKTYQACVSTTLINEALSNVLHIPTELLGFTDTWQHPLMFVYKDFNTKRMSEEQLIQHFGSSERYQQGNPDGDCILWAYDRLIKRKERKKLLIVLSDGSPASSMMLSGIEGFTKEAVKQIEKENIVDIYGIGILDASVNKYYTHRSVISKASEIAPKLLEVIERKLLNGTH